jgi:TetR/AcrR family transcriptional repressor of nem operon
MVSTSSSSFPIGIVARLGRVSTFTSARSFFGEIHESVVYGVKAAVTAGDLSSACDCDELAHFPYASLQGAILASKAERSSAPLKRFKKVVFSTLLR